MLDGVLLLVSGACVSVWWYVPLASWSTLVPFVSVFAAKLSQAGIAIPSRLAPSGIPGADAGPEEALESGDLARLQVRWDRLGPGEGGGKKFLWTGSCMTQMVLVPSSPVVIALCVSFGRWSSRKRMIAFESWMRMGRLAWSG
jgi:hypothetical protein